MNLNDDNNLDDDLKNDLDNDLDNDKLTAKTINYIGPITDAAIDSVIREIKKKHTKEKIMSNIIDPLLLDMSSRYYPYFMMLIIVMLIIIILLVSILIINIMSMRKND